MRRMTASSFCIALVFLASGVAAADPAQRSAELERLGFYVGHWTASGTMRADADTPMRPITGAETCSWAAGGYAVVCEEKTEGPGGGWEGVYILSYDAATNEYHVFGTEKPGNNLHAVGKLDGDRWLWLTDAFPDGSRARYMFAPAGAKARTMKVEVGGGTEWLEIVDLTYTAAQ